MAKLQEGSNTIIISDIRDPVNDQDTATKKYVDDNSGGGAEQLNDLTDVVISSPEAGEVLAYNGTNWVDTSLSGGTGITATGTTIAIDTAVTAQLASPTFTGTVTLPTTLTNDGNNVAATKGYVDIETALLAPLASPTFTGTVTVPATLDSDGSTVAATKGYVDTRDLNDIADVTITAPSDLQTLIYNDTFEIWVNGNTSVNLNTLTDVTVTTPTDNQVLTFDNDNSVWVNAASQGGEDYVVINSDGTLPTATGTDAIAIGEGAIADGLNSISIGRGSDVDATSTGGISIGRFSEARAADATAVGDGADALGLETTAIGSDSTATGTQAIALGHDATASFPNSAALGSESTANQTDSLAVGGSSSATAERTFAIGTSAVSAFANGGSLGNNAVQRAAGIITLGAPASGDDVAQTVELTRQTASGDDDLAISTKKYVDAGDDAYFVSNSSGTVPVAGGTDSIAIGEDASVASGSTDGIAIGKSASVVNGLESIAIGRGARADGIGSLAVGINTKAEEDNTVAIGNAAEARAIHVITIGGNGGASPQLAELHRQTESGDNDLHIATKKYVDDIVLDSLSDVTITTPENDDQLFFDTASDEWVNLHEYQRETFTAIADFAWKTDNADLDAQGQASTFGGNTFIFTEDDSSDDPVPLRDFGGEYVQVVSGSTTVIIRKTSSLSAYAVVPKSWLFKYVVISGDFADIVNDASVTVSGTETSATVVTYEASDGSHYSLEDISVSADGDGNTTFAFTGIEDNGNGPVQNVDTLDELASKAYVDAQTVAEINDIGDVTIANEANDQVLTFNSTTSMWENQASQSGGATTLPALNDVTIATPTDNQVLTFDNDTSMWVNADAQAGDANVYVAVVGDIDGGIGLPAEAEADDSVAIGRDSQSAGEAAIAIGRGAKAGNDLADGNVRSVAIGRFTGAFGDDNVVVGNASVIGNPATDTFFNDSIAIGNGADVQSASSIAIGRSTTAAFARSAAIGEDATARGVDIITLGGTAQTGELARQTASGDDDLAIATKKYVDDNSGGASALNDLTDVTLTTPTDNQVLTFDNDNSVWVNATSQAGDAYFVSNSDGTLPTAAGTDAISVGEGTTAAGIRAVSIGNLASVAGQSGVAIGRNAGASGSNSVAIGHDAGLGETLDAGEIRLGNYETNVTVDSAFAGQETKTNQVATTQYVTDHIAAAGGFVNSENANELAVVVDLLADNITYNLDLLDEVALGTAVSVNTSLSFPFPTGSLTFDDEDSWNLFTVNGSQSSSGVIAEYIGDISNKGATVTFPSGGLEFDLVYSPGLGTNATSWTAIIEAFVQNTANSNVNAGTIIGRGFTDFTSVQGSTINLDIGVTVEPVGSNGGQAKISGGGAVGMRLRMVAVSAIDADVDRIMTLDDDSGGKDFSIPTEHRDTDAQFILSNGGGDSEELGDILYNNNVDPLKTLMFAEDSVWTSSTIGTGTPATRQLLTPGSGNTASWEDPELVVNQTGDAPTATGENAIAIGRDTDADQPRSLLIGRFVQTVVDDDSPTTADLVAIGDSAKAGNEAVAVGAGSAANGIGSVSIGEASEVSSTGTAGIAIGRNAIATGANGVAIGLEAVAGFGQSAAIGEGATARAAGVLTLGSSSTTPETARQTASDDNNLAIATKLYVDNGANLDVTTVATTKREANRKFREVWEGHNISEWDTSGSNTLRELWYNVENDDSAGTHNVEIISNAGSTHYNMYFGAVADGTFISRWTKFVADAEGKVKFEYFTTVFTP